MALRFGDILKYVLLCRSSQNRQHLLDAVMGVTLYSMTCLDLLWLGDAAPSRLSACVVEHFGLIANLVLT